MKWKSVSGLAGILAIIVFCAAGLISVSFMWDRFSPFDVWIGDFGNQTVNPGGLVIYNIGCMATGILLALFYLGLVEWRTDNCLRNLLLGAGVLVGAISGVLMFLTGLISTSVQPIHFEISVLFFVLSLVGIVILSIALYGLPYYSEATACMGVTTVALTLVLALSYALEIEPIIVQWFTGFAMLSWVGLLSRDSFFARNR